MLSLLAFIAVCLIVWMMGRAESGGPHLQQHRRDTVIVQDRHHPTFDLVDDDGDD